MQVLHRLRASSKYRWIVLLSTTFAQISISFCSQGMPSLGPFFKDSFSLTSFQVGVLVSMMEMGMFFTLIVAGRLVDFYGERKVVTLGGLACGLLMLAASFAGGFWVVSALLLLAGSFTSTAVPGGSKAIMSWFPLRQRGLAMGIRQTGIPLGGALAALVLPLLAHNNGWSMSLVVAGLIANFGVLIFFFSYREHEPSSQSSSHLQPAAGKPQGLSQIMRNRNVLLVSIAGAIMIIGQYTLTIYIVFYLNEELGVPLLEASTFLAVAHFSGAFGRIVWGIASDRLYGGSRRRVLVHSGMLSVGLTLVIAALVRGTPVTLLYFLIALYGFAVVGWTGMWVALLSELAGRNRSGTALGVGMTFVQVGKVGGPPLLGLLHDLTGTYRFSWLALSVIIAIATFIFYLAREMRVD